MIKKDVIITALLTFCLTATIFTIVPTRSDYSTSDIGEYDPWCDLNDDGEINLYDVVMVTSRYDTTGTPINKTALLLELQSRLDILNASVIQLQTDFGLYQTKTIRFIEPDESIASGAGTWFDAATFVWTPTDSTNNAILNIYYYAEYRGIRGTQPFIRWRLTVNGVEYWWHQKEVWNDPYAWTPLQSIATNQNPSTALLSESAVPSQAAYVVKFQIMGYDGTAYFRNIHVLMEVVDG